MSLIKIASLILRDKIFRRSIKEIFWQTFYPLLAGDCERSGAHNAAAAPAAVSGENLKTVVRHSLDLNHRDLENTEIKCAKKHKNGPLSFFKDRPIFSLMRTFNSQSELVSPFAHGLQRWGSVQLWLRRDKPPKPTLNRVSSKRVAGEGGASLLDYAAVVGCISIVAIIGMTVVGHRTADHYCEGGRVLGENGGWTGIQNKSFYDTELKCCAIKLNRWAARNLCIDQ